MIALLLAAAASAAQPVCVRMQPVEGFEGWGRPQAAALAVGQEATLRLEPASKVHFTPALARRPKEGSYGGFFPLTVAKAGRYQIALSQGAWIDAVSHGKRIKSAAHRHGPACSGIAKIVAFDLKPGRTWFQVSESAEPAISAMVSSR